MLEISILGLTLTLGIFVEGIVELPPRIFITWFVLEMFLWSAFTFNQIKRRRNTNVVHKKGHDMIYVIYGILLVIWHQGKMETLRNKPIGKFEDNCRKEELIVGSITSITILMYAVGYYLSII